MEVENMTKEQIENGMAETFGMGVHAKLQQRKDIAADIGDSFDCWTVRGLAVPFTLVTPKPGVGNPSVTGIAKLVIGASYGAMRYAAYGCHAMSAVERKRLVTRHIPFVVPGRQVFLPFLGIALRNDGAALARTSLGIAAQRMLLSWLQGALPTPLRDRDAARIGCCSRATAFRALSELAALGLVERTHKVAVFATDAARNYRWLIPSLRRSPIRDALIEAI